MLSASDRELHDGHHMHGLVTYMHAIAVSFVVRRSASYAMQVLKIRSLTQKLHGRVNLAHMIGLARHVTDIAHCRTSVLRTTLRAALSCCQQASAQHLLTGRSCMLQVRKLLKGHTLHGLVNNAGVAFYGPLMYQPLEESRTMMETNLLGTLQVTQVSTKCPALLGTVVF